MAEEIRDKEQEKKKKTMKDVMTQVHFEHVIARQTLLLKFILRRKRNRTGTTSKKEPKVEVEIQMYSSCPPIQNNNSSVQNTSNRAYLRKGIHSDSPWIPDSKELPRSSSAFPFRQFHFTDKHLSQIVSNHL